MHSGHTGPHARRLCTALLLAVLSVLALSVFGACTCLDGADTTPGAGATAGADELLALAASIDDLRDQQHQAREQWNAERQRLELILAALRDEQARLTADIQATEAANADQAERMTAISNDHRDAHHLTERARASAARMQAELADLWANSALGISMLGRATLDPDMLGPNQATGHPTVTTAQPIHADTEFGQLFTLLEQAEIAARTIRVRQITGRLPSGQRRAAEVLCFGSAVAYWRLLDRATGETAAGVVTITGGEFHFLPASDPASAEEIDAAFAILAHEVPPRPVALPIPVTAPAAGVDP